MKNAKLLFAGISALIALAGCTTVKLIDPNKTTERVLKGQPFSAPVDGYFITDSRMHEILDLLTEKDVFQ